MTELIPTRATLLHRLKDWQDQSSWQEFFDTYWKLIYGVARRTGLTDAEALDVVQETMLSVARHMPAFRYDPAIGSFKAWLLNLTRWRILDQVRRRGRFSTPPPLSGETTTGTSVLDKVVDPASQGLDELWDAEWEKTLVDAAVAKIKGRVDPQKYQIFDFYVNKEWAPERVAAAFEVSIGQVYLAKNRVTAMIKAEVERLEKEMT